MKIRRIRVVKCPACKRFGPQDRSSRNDNKLLTLTICCHCYAVFDHAKQENKLVEPGELYELN